MSKQPTPTKEQMEAALKKKAERQALFKSATAFWMANKKLRDLTQEAYCNAVADGVMFPVIERIAKGLGVVGLKKEFLRHRHSYPEVPQQNEGQQKKGKESRV